MVFCYTLNLILFVKCYGSNIFHLQLVISGEKLTCTQELALDFHLGRIGNRHSYCTDFGYGGWWDVDGKDQSSNI